MVKDFADIIEGRIHVLRGFYLPSIKSITVTKPGEELISGVSPE